MATATQTITSRERLAATLNHREPDRIPIDFGSTSVTGIHASCVAGLRDYYGLEKRPVRVHEPFQMLGMVEEDLRSAMGLDVVGIVPRGTMFGFPAEGWKSWEFNGLEVLVPEKFNVTTDSSGDTLIYPGGDTTVAPSARMPKGGYFFDCIIRQPPLDEDELDPEDNLEEYGPVSQEELDSLARATRDAEATGLGVMASLGGTGLGDIAFIPGPSLKHPRGIRDVAEWYVSTCNRQDYIHKIFERQCEIALANLERVAAVMGSTVQAVFLCGTDFGTQTSSFCSVKTFRSLYFPYYKLLCDWIHAHTPWKIFKHSCGAVSKFVPSFIEAGIEILNPVQCSAAGMDPAELKSSFGDRIVFWGGGVDTQRVLPFATPAEVREQVLRRCEIFAPGGGFVFNTIHNIQARTPIENIVGMINAVHEFNGKN
ncbi:MAG TPA: uroporphyrinogen decarboxylase family protein [Terracidiphilus sp.]|nr:uroporphyrinogen decarboxylase family protein [Terracidiphilus sp.]